MLSNPNVESRKSRGLPDGGNKIQFHSLFILLFIFIPLSPVTCSTPLNAIYLYNPDVSQGEV
jgi:hypothetical protein